MNYTRHYWPWVLCLLGLDYFSTLAYQPSITYEIAGKLGPIATGLLVLVTLFGVLPIYCYLAGRSPDGQGAFGVIERVVRGWRGKTVILVLLGFAATDFVMLKTLSLADAAVHVRGNEDASRPHFLQDCAGWCQDQGCYWLGEKVRPYLDDQLVVTLILGVIGFVFWFVLRRGFNRNVLILAVPLIGAFLVCNGLLIVGGIRYLADHPEIVEKWWHDVQAGNWDTTHKPLWLGIGGWATAFACLLFLPRIALGLSGFEMSMILMPQIEGKPDDDPRFPAGRIANTRKVLTLAAILMSLFLLGSSFVTGLLISPEQLVSGKAANRALAYLAHGQPLAVGGEGDVVFPWCGPIFGTFYDVVTILILTLAGTSVMTALAVLLPRFLLRFGMELRWTHRWGVLLMIFAAVNFAVTVYFRAEVDSQRSAYTSSVLVLITSAGLAAALDRRKKVGRSLVGYIFTILAVGFVVVTALAAASSMTGLVIASGFIVAILAMSIMSRAVRADELRTVSFKFVDEQSQFLWESLRLMPFPVLAPHRPGLVDRNTREHQLRAEHNLAREVDLVFLEVEKGDPSDFFQNLRVEVFREENRFVIRVTEAVSIAHAIASVAIEMSKETKPPSLHFGWPELDLLAASWNYFAFGEGNIAWKVRELILRGEPDEERRPRVVVG